MTTDLSTQPVFYLFIAATLFLVLGYALGRRRNRAIYRGAFRAVLDAVEPADQTITNIGGLTGYHLACVPSRANAVSRVEATLLLLPRQALLYYPLSRLIRKHDSLFLMLTLTGPAASSLREGHLLDAAHARSPAGSITNVDDLSRETIQWGPRRFLLYSATRGVHRQLDALRQALPEPGALLHVALVPEQQRVYVACVPGSDGLGACLQTVWAWVHEVMAKP